MGADYQERMQILTFGLDPDSENGLTDCEMYLGDEAETELRGIEADFGYEW